MTLDLEKTKMSRWPVYAVETLLLSVFVLALYGQTFSFPFTGYDDPVVIVNNESIRDISSLHGLWEVLKPEAREGLYEWMPLKNLSLAIDYALFGNDARAYRPQALLWYILCVIAFHRFIAHFVSALKGYSLIAWDERSRRIFALLAALLFAAHPVHVQSVAWLSGRKDLLTMTFFFAGLAQYAKSCQLGNEGKTLRLKASAMLLYVLALLSKPSSLGFPIVVALLDGIFDRKPGFMKRHAAEYAAYFIIALAYTLVYAAALGGFDNAGPEVLQEGAVFFNGTIPQLIGQQLSVYLAWSFWPLKLLHYPLFELAESYLSVKVLAGLAALAILTLAGFFCLRKTPLLSLSVGLFIAGLFPVIGRAPYGQYYEVRYLLFSVAAPALLVAWFFVPLWRKNFKLLALAVPLIFVVFWTALTLRDSLAWSSHEALWRDALAKEPRLWVAHKNLAVYYASENNLEKAAAHADACLSINAASETCICAKALSIYRSGRTDEALNLLEGSMQYNRTGRIADNLAIIYLERGDRQKALDFYAEQIEGRLVTSYDLGQYARFLLAAGETQKALEVYTKARDNHENGAYDFEREVREVTEMLAKKAAGESPPPTPAKPEDAPATGTPQN